MKLYNICMENEPHLAIETVRGLVDATAAGFTGNMDTVIRGEGREELARIACREEMPIVNETTYANVISRIGKLVCVGLNYKAHANGINIIKQP